VANELILIVEDNPRNLKLLRDTLQVKGYQTIEAGTGEDGVRVARERQPALVLMDIQLPGISGIQALGQLRADPTTRAIPVIAVTASVMAQEPTEGHGRGLRRVPGQADQRAGAPRDDSRDPRAAVTGPSGCPQGTPERCGCTPTRLSSASNVDPSRQRTSAS
jgi:CheY-like chemotaxis protein